MNFLSKVRLDIFSCDSLILLQTIVVEESSQVACPITTKLVLDEDEETKEPLVQVHRNLVTKLKPHQVDGKDKINQQGLTAILANTSLSNTEML